jgi:hypothetical protein
MKDQLPSPDFDRQKYERPNQDWICGWTAAGKPCRTGPSPDGKCGASFECRPILEKKPGDKKGRWRCTRAPVHGGPCETGPLPDGACCKPVPRCAPTRSLRSKRGVLCIATMALLLGLILAALSGPWIWKFVSPGPVSIHHQGAAFAQLRQSSPGGQGCAACHVAAQGGPIEWIETGFNAKPGPFDLHTLALPRHAALSRIDQSCLNCHAGRNFHQPNTTRDHSCSACHREHQGDGRMKPPESTQCASCHNDAATMQASDQKAQGIPADRFDPPNDTGLIVFHPGRPKEGRATVFASFSGGHPEFQFLRQHLRDPDTLKFNHQKHLTGAIPHLNSHPLECADCHRPDAAGKYFQRINFDNHCLPCHSLQFDAQNPDLAIPHGDTSAVRTFLRTLPAQYDALAQSRGITRKRDIEKFVNDQLNRLRRQISSGENLEHEIFYTADPSKPLVTAANTLSPATLSSSRARFAGCAYCHEVRTGSGDTPIVASPRIPDRWLPGGSFNHSKHTNLSCTECHAAAKSRATSDILLPSKSECTNCHSPQGGMSETCSVCHTFHLGMSK